LSFPQKLVYW